MPSPINPHISYGRKLITLFARLLFNQREYSLIELAHLLDCSKQTILRLIDDIQTSYGIEVEENFKGRKKYYRLKQTMGKIPAIQFNKNELIIFQMCLAFTKNLLGENFFDEASESLKNNERLFLAEDNAFAHFATFHGGHIDYTPHQDTIQHILKAMNNKRVCQIEYQKIFAEEPTILEINPLKLFSHQDSIYLHALLDNSAKTKNSYLFAIHRIKKISMTSNVYEYPKEYDFEKIYKQSFGVIKQDEIEVTIKLEEFAAAFAAERSWNSESRKEWLDDETLILTFKASSKAELIGWILSWAGRAKVMEPEWLRVEVNETIRAMHEGIN